MWCNGIEVSRPLIAKTMQVGGNSGPLLIRPSQLIAVLPPRNIFISKMLTKDNLSSFLREGIFSSLLPSFSCVLFSPFVVP